MYSKTVSVAMEIVNMQSLVILRHSHFANQVTCECTGTCALSQPKNVLATYQHGR